VSDFTLSTEQAASLLRSSRQHVRVLTIRGALDFRTIKGHGYAGRVRRYRAADVLALAAQHPNGPVIGRPRRQPR
jgi:hypothetical protein